MEIAFSITTLVQDCYSLLPDWHTKMMNFDIGMPLAYSRKWTQIKQ